MSATAGGATGLPWVDGAALRAALPMPAAIDALEDALRAPPATAPPRAHHAVPGGDLLLMPAAGAEGTGVKLVTVAPGNPGRGLPLVQGVYVLFTAADLGPAALVDGAALTLLRTAAVSGLAARHLARADAEHLVLFGAGAQARAHVEAFRAVRPVRRVTVVSRTPARARSLVEDLRARGVDAAVGAASAVGEADLVAACTTSPKPVVAGADLPAGVHVTAMGAYTPHARELDTEVLRRGRVVVEDREAALSEAGDLCIPIAEGAFGPEVVAADLREVVAGAAVRRDEADVTVFKSVGLAVEDLAVVVAAVRAGAAGPEAARRAARAAP